MGLFSDKFGGNISPATPDIISKPNQPDLTCNKCGKADLARPMGTKRVCCMSCGATQ